MKKVFTAGLLIISLLAVAQDIPIGAWRTHFAKRLAVAGTVVGDEMFVACEMGMYSYNLKTKEYKSFSKIEGMASYQVNKMAYDETSKNLIIAYNDGNIDFYKDGVFTNLSNFYYYDFPGSKATNHINVVGNLLYLSTDAGLLVIDIAKKEFKATYANIGTNGTLVAVNSSLIKDDSLFLATNTGIMIGKLSPSINLQNYSKWYTYPSAESIKAAKSIVNFKGKIYGIINKNFYETSALQALKSEKLSVFDDNAEPKFLQVIEDSIYLGYDNIIKVIDKDFNGRKAYQYDYIKEMHYHEGQYYLITAFNGLVHKASNGDQALVPSSPYYNYAARINFFDKKVFVAPAYISPVNIDFLIHTGFYIFDNYNWTNVIQEQNGRPYYRSVFDVHLKGDSLLVADNFGLVKIKYDSLKGGKRYSTQNTNMTSLSGDLTFLTDINEDSKGNVFISQAMRRVGEYSFFKENSLVGSNFTQYTQDPANGRLTRRLIIDDNDYKWMVPMRVIWAEGEYYYGRGVTVYDDNSATKYKVLTTEAGRGRLTDNNVNTVCKTRNGEIWIGTDNGVCVIDDPTRIFSSSYIPDARLPVYDSRALLRNKSVDVIAVDAANRKWIATNGDGVWLFNPNGDSLLQQFNTSNSPLPSNRIYDIAVNPENGEVYFATDKGLVSYRSDASEPNSIEDVEIYKVKAFPNPVQPDYDGTIAVSGLGPNAVVKITDISGKLVYETRANGGTATWDGKSRNGERVASGIYIVFSATAEGEMGIVTKIAVLN